MKYKVGDKVRIKPKEWFEDKDNKNETPCYMLATFGERLKYCGWIGKITRISESGNICKLDLDGGYFDWSCKMIKSLDVEEKQTISYELIKDIAEVIKTHNLGVSVSENEGKLIIEPLKVEKEEDFPIDTPCMVSDNGEDWGLRYYANNHRVFVNGNKSKVEDNTTMFDFTIPCSQFNFENPSESLKYNIVKNNQ